MMPSLRFYTMCFLLIVSWDSVAFAEDKTDASNNSLPSNVSSPSAPPMIDLFNTLNCSDETKRIKETNGQIERNGKELVLWLTGYAPKESGLIFRDWSVAKTKNNEEEGHDFVYCGKLEPYSLVLENFGPDAPMLYLIDEMGTQHRYQSGNVRVYIASDKKSITSVSANPLKDTPILQVLAVNTHKQSKNLDAAYEEVLRCDVSNDKNLEDEIIYTDIVKMTDNEIVLKLNATSLNNKNQQPLGDLHFIREGESWKGIESTILWDNVECTTKP